MKTRNSLVMSSQFSSRMTRVNQRLILLWTTTKSDQWTWWWHTWWSTKTNLCMLICSRRTWLTSLIKVLKCMIFSNLISWITTLISMSGQQQVKMTLQSWDLTVVHYSSWEVSLMTFSQHYTKSSSNMMPNIKMHQWRTTIKRKIYSITKKTLFTKLSIHWISSHPWMTNVMMIWWMLSLTLRSWRSLNLKVLLTW